LKVLYWIVPWLPGFQIAGFRVPKFLFALGLGMPGLLGSVKALMRRGYLMKESCDHIDQAVTNPSYAIDNSLKGIFDTGYSG
jgi:hypothetical protein